MIFAGIDVNIITHEKADAAGIEAMGLWLWGMCYAQLHETNGRVPRGLALAAMRGKRNVMLAKRLVEAGLWLLREDGDWEIWNYEAKNQTADEIRARKAAAAERAKQWRERVRNAVRTRTSQRDEQIRTELPLQLPPSLQTQLPPPPVFGEATPPGEPKARSASRRKPETPCPSSDAEPDVIAAWAAAWGIPVDHPEFAQFLDYHRKDDVRRRDWLASWRTWERNGQKFAARSGRRGAEITKQPVDYDASWMKLPEVG